MQFRSSVTHLQPRSPRHTPHQPVKPPPKNIEKNSTDHAATNPGTVVLAMASPSSRNPGCSRGEGGRLTQKSGAICRGPRTPTCPPACPMRKSRRIPSSMTKTESYSAFCAFLAVRRREAPDLFLFSVSPSFFSFVRVRFSDCGTMPVAVAAATPMNLCDTPRSEERGSRSPHDPSSR